MGPQGPGIDPDVSRTTCMKRFTGFRRVVPWALIGLLAAGTAAGFALGLAETPNAGGSAPRAPSRDPGATSTTSSSTVSTVPPQPPVVSVAYLRPHLGVVGIANAPSSAGARLELTTDFVHWRDITPPIPGPDKYGDTYRFTDVSFLNPRLGWVVAYSEPVSSLRLYRTTDGGRNWRDEGQAPGCGSVCAENVDFVDPLHGWREVIEAMAGQVSLASTADGGRTWSPVHNPARWPAAGLLSFSDTDHGFIADTLPPNDDFPTTGNSLGHFSELWSTSDGGTTWQQDSTELPGGYPTAQTYVDLPTSFENSNVVLPVALFEANTTAVAFYTSRDGGASWSLASVEPTSSLLHQGQAQWPSISSVVGGLEGVFPSVSVAAPGTWWVVSGAWPGHPMVQVTSDSGGSWTNLNSTGLPPLISSLQAVNATTAWATVDGSGCGLVGTANGGATWYPICPGI